MKRSDFVSNCVSAFPGIHAYLGLPVAIALTFGALPVLAQAPTPPAPAALREDEAMTRARQAYDALPAGDRRAIQDNLVWTGIYKGGVDGEFGRMTYNAMRAWTNKRPGAAEGILSAQDRAALAAEAAKARAAVEFRTVQEPRAGFALGIPQKVFVRKSDVPSGARFETADKSAGVETFTMRESATSLQAFYDSLRATAPNRKVTYSVLRPDFFVVTAETPTRASYTRVARGNAGNEATLRGFTVTWPKTQQARYEILSVAIANSFDPFGQRAAIAKAGDGKPPASGSVDASQRPSTMIAPPQPAIFSTAIALAPNRYVAVLPVPACNDPRIGSRPARLVKHDPVTNLVLFEAPGANATRLRAAPQKGESNAPAVVLFAGPGDRPNTSAIAAATGALSEIVDPAKPARLIAYLPAEAIGAPVLSRKGELLGIVGPVPAGARKIAGAPPPASRALIPAAEVASFATASGLELLPSIQAGSDSSAGKLAADHRGSLEALWCMSPR